MPDLVRLERKKRVARMQGSHGGKIDRNALELHGSHFDRLTFEGLRVR
jgi:hypothetical protein